MRQGQPLVQLNDALLKAQLRQQQAAVQTAEANAARDQAALERAQELKERGFLSVIVEDAFETEYLFDVPPDAFRPIPKVWSSVVLLRPKPAVIGDPVLFRKIVSVSFAQKRKTILNNLKALFKDPQYILADAGIDGLRRAETLTLDEWRRLTDATKSRPQSGIAR